MNYIPTNYFPWLLAISFFLGWLLFGHYWFRGPKRKSLAGHQVTVYGNAGLILALGVYAVVYYFLGLGEVWQLFLIPAMFLAIGAIFTWAMHQHDGHSELSELRAQIAAQQRQIEQLEKKNAA